MNSENSSKDVKVIRQLIEATFEAINCDEERPSDWERFVAPCIDETSMIPSARPARRDSIDSFVDMMKTQMDNGSIKTFSERALAHQVQVFGNIAVAMTAYEATVNGGSPARGVNAYLLVRDETWKIAAVAWDTEGDDKAILDKLVSSMQ